MPDAPQLIAPSRSAGSVVLTLIKALTCWFIHLVVFLMVVGVGIKIVPVFERQLQLYELDLPAPTRLTIYTSQMMTRYWYLPGMFFLVLNACLFVALYFLPERFRWIRRTWFVAILLLAIAYFCHTLVALAMPWAAATQTISG